MLKSITYTLFFVMLSPLSYAQEAVSDSLYEKDTEYIKSYLNRIAARAFYVNTSNSFVVNSRLDDQRYELTPNKQNRIGASASFRFISLSYSFTPDFLAENEDNEDSRLFNLNLRTYFGQWMQTLDVFSEKGFYLSDGAIKPYFPDIRTLKIGGSTAYIFNKNFSFRAIATQDETQLKSAGSFIPRVYYFYTKYRIKSGDIDDKMHSYDFALAPGYFYNLVPIKDLMISAGVSAGIGFNYSTSKDETLTSLLTELNFRGVVSYNISNFYLGSHYSYLILNHNTDRSSYVNDHIPFFQIFVGYRFKAPKSWVTFFDSVEDKIGL